MSHLFQLENAMYACVEIPVDGIYSCAPSHLTYAHLAQVSGRTPICG